MLNIGQRMHAQVLEAPLVCRSGECCDPIGVRNETWRFGVPRAEGERVFGRALELAPGDAETHVLFAQMFVTIGRQGKGFCC